MRRGLTLFTRVRKNMKSLPLSLQDKALLNARNMAETIIGHIKEFSSLNLSRHRSVINAFVHIIAAITAYQINPFKPKRNLQLETTVCKPLIRVFYLEPVGFAGKPANRNRSDRNARP